MKHFLLRTITYVGLYAEIFSASCRWIITTRHEPWRSFVTKSLVTAGYLHPTAEAVAAKKLQQEIVAQFGPLHFHSTQPETIQTCLKFDIALLEKAYRGKNHPQATYHQEVGAHVPAIPPVCQGDL